jgi:hypothetical protein
MARRGGLAQPVCSRCQRRRRGGDARARRSGPRLTVFPKGLVCSIRSRVEPPRGQPRRPPRAIGADGTNGQAASEEARRVSPLPPRPREGSARRGERPQHRSPSLSGARPGTGPLREGRPRVAAPPRPREGIARREERRPATQALPQSATRADGTRTEPLRKGAPRVAHSPSVKEVPAARAPAQDLPRADVGADSRRSSTATLRDRGTDRRSGRRTAPWREGRQGRGIRPTQGIARRAVAGRAAPRRGRGPGKDRDLRERRKPMRPGGGRADRDRALIHAIDMIEMREGSEQALMARARFRPVSRAREARRRRAGGRGTAGHRLPTRADGRAPAAVRPRSSDVVVER